MGMQVPMLKQVKKVAFAAVAAFGFAGGVSAQDAGNVTASYQDWVVSCTEVEGVDTCAMAQQLALNDSDATLTLEISAAENGGATGIMILPFGLDVTKGISVSVDGGPRFNLPFRTCRQFGCVVQMSFDGNFADTMRQGIALQTTLYPVDSAPEINAPFSLSGFTEAFLDLQNR